MVRKARQLSQTGIYHIMVRGINGQNIFCDEDDFKRYLDTLARISEEEDAQVFAYCLMSNHVHLLIRAGKDGVSRLMKRLGGVMPTGIIGNMNAKDMYFKIDSKVRMLKMMPI